MTQTLCGPFGLTNKLGDPHLLLSNCNQHDKMQRFANFKKILRRGFRAALIFRNFRSWVSFSAVQIYDLSYIICNSLTSQCLSRSCFSLCRIKAEMEVKLKEVEDHKSREVEEMRLEKAEILTKLDKEKQDLERQKEELEALIHREKVELDKERQVLEREKLEEIEGVIREKEMEIEDLKEKAQHEIDELRERLDETER